MAFVGSALARSRRGEKSAVRKHDDARQVAARTPDPTRCVACAGTAPSARATFPVCTASAKQRAEAVDALCAELTQRKDSVLSREDVEWYLRDRGYDVAEARQKLVRRVKWIEDMQRLPSDNDVEMRREIETMKAVVCEETDKFGRGVLLVNAKRHVQGEFSKRTSRRVIKHQLDEAIRRLDDIGSETLLVLVDLRGFSLQNADLTLVSYLIDVFFVFYPRRLDQILLLDAPLLFRPTWLAIKPLLRSYAKLVSFASISEAAEYFPNRKMPSAFRAVA